jgi:hypothetical protein
MARSHILCAASLIVIASLGPSLVLADEVIPPKVLVRHFPQGQFCALPVAISFIAPAGPIKITFTALRFVDDGSGTLVWTEQSIDNVTLVPTSQVAAHWGPPPAGSASENCYIGDPTPTPYLHFNQPGLSLLLFDQFDSDPTPRGWDMLNGAYYKTTATAPRDVDSVLNPDFSGGSLGLGDGSGTPTASATASSSIIMGGLVQGESYDLGAWWDANFVRFPHDTPYLTISIDTVSGTPVARRSWGGVKSSYR